MKIVQDLNSLKDKTAIFSDVIDMGDISYDKGTKAKVVEVISSRVGWYFILDLSHFIKENMAINGQYDLNEDDFKESFLLIWDVNKFPEIPIEIED